MDLDEGLSLSDLFLQSIYLERLLDEGKLARVHEVLPSVLEVVDVWKRYPQHVQTKEVQLVFLSVASAFSAIDHDDKAELRSLLIDLMFLSRGNMETTKKRTPDDNRVARDTFNVLLSICEGNCGEVIRCLRKSSGELHTADMLYFYDRLVTQIIHHPTNFPGITSLELVKRILTTSIGHVGSSHESEEPSPEDAEMLDDDQEAVLNLSRILDVVFESKKNNTEDRFHAIQIIVKLCILSSYAMEKFFPVLQTELYYADPHYRAHVLAGLADLSALWPNVKLLSTPEEDDEESLPVLVKLMCDFVNGPDAVTQKIATVGLCRLLLDGISPATTRLEETLPVLVSKSVDPATSEDLQRVLKAFFSEFGEKKGREESIGDTIVHLLIEAFERVADDEDLEMQALSEQKTAEINLLMTMIDPRNYTTLIEGILVNLKAVYDQTVSQRTIMKWLQLKNL